MQEDGKQHIKKHWHRIKRSDNYHHRQYENHGKKGKANQIYNSYHAAGVIAELATQVYQCGE
jgi:hypothetical protein